MGLTGTDTAARTLSAVHDVLRQPLGEILPALSRVLRDLVPHAAAAELATHCAHSPVKTAGDTALTSGVTAAALGPLLSYVPAGAPWQGELALGGVRRPVLAVVSDATPRGALLVLVRQDAPEAEVPAPVRTVVQALWDVVTSHYDRLATEAVPGQLAPSRAAAGERARVLAALSEAHASTLSALLGVLRSRGLDDGAARASATDLAASALVDLRAERELDQALVEEPADRAFTRLADSLRPLLRHGPVRLELGPPATDRPLPDTVAHVARAVVRALVLTVLEQETVGRVHVGWTVSESSLRATVRDDGPGELTLCRLGPHRVRERLEALGGRLEIDAVPGWGTTVTASLPLGSTPPAPAEPLAALGSRELEVLGRLARGHRNRVIAEDLHISESTVKFHVANILGKLGVSSRGEASAVFHAAAQP
ncbi:LuxR C-terminal-related transcriptional regulator [Streptomyces sp. NPDC007088]|uniref:LuxR C-terminal-related transcriptional regulator n=1 Tax=Streptomyces sp. NPDC007088 TaxID=3364773 RepID=UPI00368B5504